MHRRTVIKNLALVIGGAVLLPACHRTEGKASLTLKNVEISADQEKLVGGIAETIIPKTTTPGARDLNLHLFVFKMLDDCYKKEDQQAFVTGMGQFTDAVKNKYDKPFSDLSQKQREDVLLSIENDKDEKSTANSKELKSFYGIIKRQTVNGYVTSKYFMTKQVVYELVPGRYNARFPYKQKQSA